MGYGGLNMFKNKYIVILLFLIIAFSAISCVSATELNSTDDIADSNVNEEIEINQCDDTLNLNQNDEDTVVADENDSILTDNRKSFTDLANLINKYSIITLEYDYEYLPSDGNLEKGIEVDDFIKINGNGHTIYGNGARFLCIEEDGECHINNLVFINSYSDEEYWTHGGAIVNEGHLEIRECSFFNNYAGESGGAIYNNDLGYLKIYDSFFIDNHAESTEDADGGAISSIGYLYVSNSVFGNCSACFGGAIATNGEAYIEDCYFGYYDEEVMPNVADNTGGAIYNHREETGSQPICEVSATDDYDGSYFNFNEAEYGGALYNCIAMNVEFGSDNYANSKKGHNMYYGVRMFCEDYDSNSNNNYETIEAKGFITSPVNLIVDPKDNLFKILVKNNAGNGEPIPGVEVYIVVDGGVAVDTDLYVDEDNWIYNTTDNNGIVAFPLSGLNKGYHSIKVAFTNTFYNYGDNTYNVHLGFLNATINYNKNINFNYGGSDSVTVDVVGGRISNQNVYVVGYPNKVSVKNNVITVFGLNAGTYTLHVDSTPNQGYVSTTTLIPITVNKVFGYLSASAFSAIYKSNNEWTVRLKDANGRGIAGVNIIMNVGGKTYSKISDSQGKVHFKASIFKAGTQKVTFSASTGNYIIVPVTTTAKITKQTKISYKFDKTTKNSATALTVTVFKKGTKKSINNVKITIQVCKGKKVLKTYKAKTKKMGKFYAFAFGTNKFAKGKYTVKFSPIGNKYVGNGKTSIVISKKGKWLKIV